MSPSAAVLVCALDLLGRSKAVAPIELIPTPPSTVSSNAEAFIRRDPDTIYLITSAAVFQDALHELWPGARGAACRKLASIIVHEEWHLRNGPSEQGAYLAQLTTLAALGADRQTLQGVRMAMAAVKKKEAQRRLMASLNRE